MSTAMVLPHRIQRKRTKGWLMPPGAIYVGRPSKWGNPYRVGWGCETLEKALYAFRRLVLPYLLVSELAGHDLACWCKEGEPCHGDILLEAANA